MADDRIKTNLLLEFLDNPAHHPQRAEIVARLAKDVLWRREWREWRVLRKLARLTVTEEALGADIRDEEWPAFLDDALSPTRMNQLKENLFVSRESREKFLLLSEAIDASNNGPTLSGHLFQQALALGTSDGSTTAERAKPSLWKAVGNWLGSLSGWFVGLAGATTVAVLLVIVMTGNADYSFPPATQDQAGRVQALAPTELKSITFGERLPLPSLGPMRMGYLAALARDMVTLGDDRNLAPQLDLLARLDPRITEEQQARIKGGKTPCTDLASADESQCLAGSTLYHLLRQGPPFGHDDLARVRQALSRIGPDLDDPAMQSANANIPDLPDILQRFVTVYLW